MGAGRARARQCAPINTWARGAVRAEPEKGGHGTSLLEIALEMIKWNRNLWTWRNTTWINQPNSSLYQRQASPFDKLELSFVMKQRGTWGPQSRLDCPKRQHNTTYNIQQKTQQMSRHWLRQYTTYNIFQICAKNDDFSSFG